MEGILSVSTCKGTAMKQIPNYKGKYSITLDGKVWSEIRGRFLSPQLGQYGYWVITLSGIGKNNRRLKTHYIHRLIADAYLPKVKHKLSINHKNGIKTDNRIENLEWSTQKENVRHYIQMGLIKRRKGELHQNSKLSDADVLEIRSRLDSKYGTLTRLAKEYDVSPSLLHLIREKNHRAYA